MSLKKIASGLSRRPAVVGAINSLPTLEAALRLRPEKVDFLELRLDALVDALDEIEAAIPRLKPPLILTVRHAAEGGAARIPPATRREIFERFLPHATLIDIELRSVDQMGPVIAEAARQQVGVIASHHNFLGTPPRLRLQELARRAMLVGATVFKLATTTNSLADVSVLLAFMALQKRILLSVMGMGKYGRASRLLFAQAGSVLNYGYLGDSSPVSGQWPAEQLRERIDELE